MQIDRGREKETALGNSNISAEKRDEGARMYSMQRSICGGCVNFHCCTWVDNTRCEGRQERRSFDCSVLNGDDSVLKRRSDCLGGGR